MKTDELIEAIVKDLRPVTPLAHPARRATAWLVGSALYCAALALYSGGAQIAVVLFEVRLWLPQAAAFATASIAAFAAFASVVPGHPQRLGPWVFISAAAAWIATLLASTPPNGGLAHLAGAREEWECVRFIAIGGALPLAALVLMLRRGAPLQSRATAALAAVAAGALLSVGACVARPHDDGAVTLFWHGGAIAAIALVCVAAAGTVFTWARPAARPARGP
jgi:hypothetical protein